MEKIVIKKSVIKKTEKTISVALASMLLLSLSACGNASADSKVKTGNNVQNTIDQQVAKETSSEETTQATTEATTQATTEATTVAGTASSTDVSNWDADVTAEEIEKYSSEDADIDLTKMDSNMIYSTVYQLTYDAHSYEGKMVKMKGQYYVGIDQETGAVYHFILMKDAQACCQQGIEFVWGDGSHKYPDESPADGTDIVVLGRYETYKDNPDDEYEFCRIANASMEVVKN